MTHSSPKAPSLLQSSFDNRHIGPNAADIEQMLKTLGFSTLDELAAATVPRAVRTKNPKPLSGLMPPVSEHQALSRLKELAKENHVFHSYIGMGYSNCITPAVIQRHIFENPGWYTQYTPYQAEISQGRLEALLTFQTMIMDLTAMDIANASLLDEGTAAAEAMAMCFSIDGRNTERAFFVSQACHPQTLGVLKTRAAPLKIRILVGDHNTFDFKTPIFGAILQYPATDGVIHDYSAFIEKAHAQKALITVAADILSLAILKPPGEFGADIVVGNTQRFGVPMGYGGPHAAFFATRDAHKRQMPGRIVGISQDADGKPAIRLALQTREQHIRRDKATSNICTAQVLLAIMASQYAAYHGPDGIRKISERVHLMTALLKRGLEKLGVLSGNHPFFDTLTIPVGDFASVDAIHTEARRRKVNFRAIDPRTIGISLDETTAEGDVWQIIEIFSKAMGLPLKNSLTELAGDLMKELGKGQASNNGTLLPASMTRTSKYLTHSVFNNYHSETEMMRYLHNLQSKDLSLTFSMIPLGSCTMKLNAAAEMLPISWPELSQLHPFVPHDQAKGYQELFKQLSKMLSEITGFPGVSLQPNAGSQGEYAGLLVIRHYYEKTYAAHRDVCLIPRSAHGTNPASAAMAGMKVVVVDCDSQGNVNLNDLRKHIQENRNNLAALMLTYPSTHGVFEEGVIDICSMIHEAGGQVYMDGANMNAQIGLCVPAELGVDVCHLNLHKTFAIPHGGGGPGVGPICVRDHLVPFLPSHPVVPVFNGSAIGPVAAAPWGSASILPISWMYISMMGAQGLTRATQVAILNANYIAKRLSPHFPVLFRGKEGMVAHECIFDLRPIKEKTGIDVEDVAKRLMDYGFHAPTMSFPVPGTLMVEPTESESKAELDRFCDAMIAIRAELGEIEAGKADRQNNVLKNAPHTVEQVTKTEWNRPYSREKAAFPLPYLRTHKFWPPVARINNVLGDRQLICGCGEIA